ncbi:hypothetical protein LXL04_008890 [Taraxacum kok-saghyz]
MESDLSRYASSGSSDASLDEQYTEVLNSRLFFRLVSRGEARVSATWDDPLTTREMCYIGNTDSDMDIQCFELVILRRGDCTETRPSHATLNLLNRRHPVSRRFRATDHLVNQRPRVHKPSVSIEACKLFKYLHKLAPGEDRTRVSPKSDACPYHPDRGGRMSKTLDEAVKMQKFGGEKIFAIQEPPPAKAVTNQNIDGFIYIPFSKKIRKRENILIAENCMKANYELIFLWGEIAAFKIRPEVINPSEPTTFAAAI